MLAERIPAALVASKVRREKSVIAFPRYFVLRGD
jgi:hypothetical protein